MIFDIKMEDFCRKTQLVAGGHMTYALKTITYASVVSHDTVCLALTDAVLNDLQVKAGDIQNAYVTAPTTEKVLSLALSGAQTLGRRPISFVGIMV